MAWTNVISLIILVQVCYVTFKLYARMEPPQAPHPNVLLIIADGLRPDFGIYRGSDADKEEVYTPNIDELTSSALTFLNAYAQYSTGLGSRASMFTGRYPDMTHVYDSYRDTPNLASAFTTLPQYFKEHGYLTAGMGRVFGGGEDFFRGDAWTHPFYIPETEDFWNSQDYSWRAVTEKEEAPSLPDLLTTLHAMETLRKFSNDDDDTPFFMVVGYERPSAPFIFPAEFLSYYPGESSGKGVNVSSHSVPWNMPSIAWSGNKEIRRFEDMSYLSGSINSTLTKTDQLDLRRAYYASVSFIDAQIGRIRQSLNDFEVFSNTITVVVGSTGYLLGEHAEWCTDASMDLPARVPLIIHDPRETLTAGHTTQQLIELLSLFQTLADFAEIDMLPGCEQTRPNLTSCVEGHSAARIFKDASHTLSDKAFTQTLRHVNSTDFSVMGYSVRTKRYRYTEWVKFDDVRTFIADWNVIFGYELYDHKDDPNENSNVVNGIIYKKIVRDLSEMLRDHYVDHMIPIQEI